MPDVDISTVAHVSCNIRWGFSAQRSRGLEGIKCRMWIFPLWRTKKVTVFAVALSIGSVVACEVPLCFDSAAWRKAVRSLVGPALRSLYPDNRHIVILLDGEKPFHSAESKREMRKWGLKALPGWPSRSPDLNPAEHMWPA